MTVAFSRTCAAKPGGHPCGAVSRSLHHQRGRDDRQCRLADAGGEVGGIDHAAPVGRRCLQPGVRRPRLGGRKSERPSGPQRHSVDRFDRFRRGEPGRCIFRDHRRTHCFPRLHGPGSSSDVSLDAVLARQCLHRTRRTRHGDRAVGCHDRGRHSDRPNSRWVASRALLVGEHLRLYGRCRRRDSGPRRGFGAEFSGSEHAADRLAGSYVVSGRNDGSDFRRHRSAGLGMDISLRLGLSRRRLGAPQHLRPGRAAYRVPHARCGPLSQSPVHSRQWLSRHLLLCSLGFHLPRCPVLPNREGVHPPGYRGPSSTCGRFRGRHFRRGHQTRRSGGEQGNRRNWVVAVCDWASLGFDRIWLHDLPRHRRSDAVPRLRDGSHERAGHRSDHGRAYLRRRPELDLPSTMPPASSAVRSGWQLLGAWPRPCTRADSRRSCHLEYPGEPY